LPPSLTPLSITVRQHAPGTRRTKTKPQVSQSFRVWGT
jgi:hypothetical protein